MFERLEQLSMSMQVMWGERLVERFGDRLGEWLLEIWVIRLYEGLGDSLGERLCWRLGER